MLEFIAKEQYSLTPKFIKSQLGFETAQLKSIFFLNFLAVGGKRLIIHSRVKLTNYKEIDEAEMVFDLSDSKMTLKNISASLRGVEDASSFISDTWRVSRLSSNLLFTRRSSIAKLLPNYGKGEAVDIAIKNPFPKIRNTAGTPVNIRPNAWQKVIGEGSVIPMPITDGTKTRYLCFLNVDIDNRTAEWLLKPPFISTKSSNRISRIFNRSKDEISHETLLKLPISEFREGSKVDAAIQNVMLKNERLYIFTRGMNEALHSKSGHGYSVVAHIDYKGNVLSKPFFLDHNLNKDQKKRGHLGAFTSSKKYCILKSIYKAADDWKGKQRLLDLEANILEEIKLPRGYAHYQLVDHFGDDFWFQEKPTLGNAMETKVVRFELL